MSDKPQTAVLHTPLMLVSMPLMFLSFALPIAGRAIGASALEIGGLFTVFTIVVLVIRPLVGFRLDRHGRKPFIIAALCIYGIASLVFSRIFTFDPGYQLAGLYVARALQGLGAALLLITVDTITSDLTTPDNRAAAIGRNTEKQIRGGAWGGALWFSLSVAMPMPWPEVFLAWALAAFVGAVMLWRNLPETRRANVSSVHEDVGRPRLHPLLKRLMAITFFTAFAEALIAPIYLIYLQDLFTTDTNTLALAFFPALIVLMFLPSRLGRISDRFGRAPAMAVGAAVTGTLYLSLPSLPGLNWLIAAYTLSSIGWALADPARTAMVGDLTHEDHLGRSFGIYQIFSGVGYAAGPLVGGWLYDSISQEVPFYVNGAILLSAAIAMLLLLRERASSGTPRAESE